MKVYRDIVENGETRQVAVFDIVEAIYSGEFMGKRMITATIKFETPIDFKIGDYVVMNIQDLVAGNNKHGNIDELAYEKFYIYTEPQCKKTARPMSASDAFETTVVFYPRQYELSCIQMRDFVSQTSSQNIIYTGFDEVTFYGGAHELLERCMACMAQQYKGNDAWSYVLADEVNEIQNTALESFAFTFKGNSVMDALLKLNDKDGINTTFFINGRTIYVGYKSPYLCKVDDNGLLENTPLRLMYGKTSDKSIGLPYGGLYDITKSVGEELPITKLFAYGASRNLNRYYCADRIQSGRFVNKLMLPSFSNDGVTDYIISKDGMKKYGIVEGSKDFEEIYPSLRYMTYADIRGIKYCIKVRTSGLNSDPTGKIDHMNSLSAYPIARVQCYRVEPCTGDKTGRNRLVEAAPPEDLAVYIHATGKTIKVLLCGGQDALSRQLLRDAKVPTRDGDSDYIPGSCFCVHDPKFDDPTSQEDRTPWFDTPTATSDRDSSLHRIEYVDTFWLTDLYVFTAYDQVTFKRDGYSAWAWPRLNDQSNTPDSLLVNEVVDVEPVVIPDTSDNISGGRQQHFDIYLRDVGFAIDEQNDFGEMVFVFSSPVVSVLDGILAGREFTIDGGDNLNDFQSRVVCAYKDDGSFNDDFMLPGDSGDMGLPAQALAKGAIWRVRLNRNDSDKELGSVGLVIPNTDIQMSAGDHIVLLDIYMPDIYIRAAENRLLRESKKFLDSNDKGDIKYAISFDKVRIQQIPQYALQMREGVRLRVVDPDLRITSDNISRKLIDYDPVAMYDIPLFETVTSIKDEVTETRQTYELGNYFHKRIISYSAESHRITIKVDRRAETATIGGEEVTVEGATKHKGISFVISTDTYNLYKEDLTVVANGDHYLVSFNCDEIFYYRLTRDWTIVLFINETTVVTSYSKELKTANEYVPAIAEDYIDFKAGKYYEIEMQVDSSHWTNSDDSTVSGRFKKKDIILTPSKGDLTASFVPEYEITNVSGRVKYKFYLPDNFNDNHGYYIALLYHGDGVTEYGKLGLYSVLEKDLSAPDTVVDYVDFIASRVTIRITDNSRPGLGDDIEYADDKYKRDRIAPFRPEIIREIQADITEQTKASAWGQLMNKVEDTAIEVDKAQQIYADLIQAARSNYQRLMALKNNIFDPDGTCNDLFLQTMMLQVGADSMNYRLVNTYSEINNGPDYRIGHNYTISGRDTSVESSRDVFAVKAEDLLSHYVYIQGSANHGQWRVPPFSKILDKVNDAWPVYYIAIKCSRNGEQAQWVCETAQHAVNEDANYWYFNWGILQPDSNGVYALTETRGNAYMYGDNIIAGKISTMAGNSYFDLTHGNFVLGEGTEQSASLKYIDGVLTIGGLNDAEGIGKTINDLGLGIDNIVDNVIPNAICTNNQTYVDVLFGNLQNQIDGVVDSYFMEGIPTMDETKKPLSDWKAESDPIDYAKHEGDTYTNIRNFGDELKPEEWEQGWIYTTSGYSGKTLDEIKSISSDSNHSKGVRFSRLIQYKAGDSLWVNPGNANRTVIVAYFDSQGKLADSESYTGIAYPNGGEIVLDATYSRCNVSIRSTSGITTSIVPALAICINPKAGHSWRFCRGTDDSSATTWHWHEIADSDAVKALQDAAQAQDTADGKRRCFTTQPVPPYDPGDLWVNANGTDTTANPNITYVNALLRCNTRKAKGQLFDIHDWEYSSRAITAADDAQAAADDANRKVDNIASDGIISGGTEKQTLNKEFIEIAGSNRDRTTSATDGSYRKVMMQAGLYGIDTTAMVTAFDDLRDTIKVILGASGDTINDSNIQNDTYIGADYNGSLRYDIVFYENIGSLDSLLLDENSKTGTRMRISANRLYEISIGNSTNSGTLSLYEKFGNAYTKLGDINLIPGSPINSEFRTIGGGTFSVEADIKITLTNISLREINKIDRNKFNQLWKAYYDAEIAVLNAISDTINDTEIGGENVLCVNEVNKTYNVQEGSFIAHETILTPYSTESGSNQYTLIPSGDYVFSANVNYYLQNETEGVIISVYLEAYNANNVLKNRLTIANGNLRDKKFSLSEACYIKLAIEVDTSDVQEQIQESLIVSIQNIMLQKGERSTSFQEYVKHLTDALHGSTQVAGGLTMTNLLMLKNEQGEVISGMSGLTGTQQSPENVAMWAGGTYQDALNQLAGIINTIPLLLTKLGIGSKIGCFEVVSSQRIKVSSNIAGQYIVIDAVTGIHMYNDNKEVISISPNAVLEPSGFNVTIGKNNTPITIGSEAIMFSKTISSSNIIVPANDEYIIGLTEGHQYFIVSMQTSNTNMRLSLGRLRFYNITTGDYFDAEATLQGPIIIQSGIKYQLNVAPEQRIYLTAGSYRVDVVFNCQNAGSESTIAFDYTDTLSLSKDVITYQKIIIGNNGILCSKSSSKYAIINTGSNKDFLDIKLVGLPSLTQTTVGQIYRKGDGTLMIGTGQS